MNQADLKQELRTKADEVYALSKALRHVWKDSDLQEVTGRLKELASELHSLIGKLT